MKFLSGVVYNMILFYTVSLECCLGRLTLPVNIQEANWNITSFMSACNACSSSVNPGGLFIRPHPYLQPPARIFSFLGPVFIQEDIPVGSPAVLVFRNGEQRELDEITWNPDSCYVILLLRWNASPYILLKSLWESHRVHKVFLVMAKEPEQIITYDPFQKSFKVTGKPETEVFPNLFKTELNVVFFSRSPTMKPASNRLFTGVDGEMLKVLETKMNFTSVLKSTSDGNRYGSKLEDGSFTGTLKDLLDGTADLAINGHFIKEYNTDDVKFTRYVTVDQLCAVVPKASQMPHVLILARCFPPTVWILIVVSYTVIGLFQNFKSSIQKTKPPCATLDILQLIFTAPPAISPKLHSDRILHGSVLLFTFILVNICQGNLITFLNSPPYYPEIETLKDIQDSGYEIWSSSPEIESMLKHDEKLASLTNQIHLTSDSEVKCAASTRKIVRFTRYSHLERMSLEDYKELHTVRQCLSTFFIAYLLPRGSPLLRRINGIIAAAVESGLVQHWTEENRRYINGVRERNETVKVFNIHDLQVAFVVLIGGHLLSLGVFIFEISYVNRNVAR